MVDPDDKAGALAFFKSLTQAASVSKAIWLTVSDPTTAGSQTANFAENFQPGLALVMTDHRQFLAFAIHGAYNDDSPPSFSPFPRSFQLAPDAYAYSALLQQNGRYAVPGAPVATVEAFHADCEKDTLNEAASFCTQNGKTIYWSATTKRTYAFSHKGRGPSDIDLLTRIVTDNWLSLDLLFDGSYNCTAAGRAGGSVLQFDYDGTPDVSCLSQLPIYLSCNPKAECPTKELVDGKCPFGYDGRCASMVGP